MATAAELVGPPAGADVTLDIHPTDREPSAMSLTFYYSPMSTAVITELVLDELAVPCERIRIDLKKGESRTPEFLRLNPNGKVPMLVHDGIPIWESVAITLYLGEIFGVAKGLYPEPGPERGEAM